MNIVEPIFAQCRNKPSELVLCAPGTEFDLASYARLQRSVDNICRRIIAAGIAPRSSIGVVISDPILHVMMLIALTRLGIITVSANDRNVCWPIALDGVIADWPLQSSAGNTVLADAGWTAGSDQPLDEKHLYHATANDLCRIFLISGSDGKQKAIAMTHGMIATRLDRQKLFLGSRAPFCDRTHLDLPLNDALGFQVMLGTLWRGGALLMTWDVRKTLTAVAAYKIQNLVSTPQSLIKLADAVQSHAAYRSELVAVFCLGDLKPELSQRVRASLCSNLTLGYIAGDRTMAASMPAHFASGIAGSVGYVMPGVTVEAVTDQDHVLPRGKEGTLRIRSDYGIKEYLGNTAETQRAFRDGWFYSGTWGTLTNGNALVISRRTESGIGQMSAP